MGEHDLCVGEDGEQLAEVLEVVRSLAEPATIALPQQQLIILRM